MKKLFSVLILLTGLSVVFAETGIDGLNWYMKYSSIEFPEVASYWETEETQVVFLAMPILGEQALKSYVFENEELSGVSYCITKDTAKELRTKLKEKKVYEINTKTIDTTYIFDKVYQHYENGTNPDYFDLEHDMVFYRLLGEIEAVKTAKKITKKGYKALKKTKKKDGTLYIYDYNDDTRIYMFDVGFVFVAYVPFYKDY